MKINVVLSYQEAGKYYKKWADEEAKIDFKSFAPLLQILGVSKDGIDFLSSDKFEEILLGQTDLKTLLPILANLFKQKDDGNEQESKDAFKGDFVAPIKEVAPTEVEESINSYFS